jgi:hypothetical protein
MGWKTERKQNTYAVRGMGKMGECETAGKGVGTVVCFMSTVIGGICTCGALCRLC